MDELEQRIRAARPISGHRDLPLSERARRELADLLLADAARPPADVGRIRRRGLLFASGMAAAIAAVATVAVIATTTLLNPAPVYAATPQMLETTPVDGTAKDLLTELADTAATRLPDTQDAAFTIDVQGWALSIVDDGTSISTTVVPQDYEFTGHADGARSMRSTYAQPIDQNGDPVGGKGLPAPGQLSWEQHWGPGEYQPAFPDPFPTTAAEVGPFLATWTGTTEPLSASAAINELNSLLREQELDAAQQAALLTYLSDLPYFGVAGTVTDRLGRAGIMFTTDPRHHAYVDHIIIDPDTGRILATERIYTGHERTDIPSPSVVGYSLWR